MAQTRQFSMELATDYRRVCQPVDLIEVVRLDRQLVCEEFNRNLIRGFLNGTRDGTELNLCLPRKKMAIPMGIGYYERIDDAQMIKTFGAYLKSLKVFPEGIQTVRVFVDSMLAAFPCRKS